MVQVEKLLLPVEKAMADREGAQRGSGKSKWKEGSIACHLIWTSDKMLAIPVIIHVLDLL